LTKRILIAEDEDALRNLLKAWLRSAGYEVLEAATGKEVLEIAERERLDLIILDIMMPELDGWRALKHLRERGINLPVIILSARDTYLDFDLAYKLKVNDYFVKPFEASELLEKVNEVLSPPSLTTYPIPGYTIEQLHSAYKRGEADPMDIALEYLERANQLNPKLNAFITIFPEEEIKAQAQKAREMIRKGEATPLTGIPISIKDNINVKGYPTTCASKILESYISPYDATVINRLKSAGAIILGKTNLDEFAMGSSTENSAFGPTRNPFDLSRVPGGSSGGSGASVAADMSIASLGSDTGGSIRLPAAFTGIYGLKPTYGLVSRYGLVAFASSLDQIGPMAKTPEDISLLLDAISGFDPKDSTSWQGTLRTYPLSNLNLKSLKIGILEDLRGLAPEIEHSYLKLIGDLESKGVTVVPLTLKTLKYSIPVYYLIACSEASSNLARFDGVRYGLRATSTNYREMVRETRGMGFGREVKRRIILGTFALSQGYFDKYYLKAQKIRTLMRKEFQEALQKVDVILTPTSPTLPFKLGEKINDPLKMYLSDIFTTSVNLAGLPAISFPIGVTDANLPIGMQLIGSHFSEKKLISIAKALSS